MKGFGTAHNCAISLAENPEFVPRQHRENVEPDWGFAFRVRTNRDGTSVFVVLGNWPAWIARCCFRGA
jgi:hypothetical protein